MAVNYNQKMFLSVDKCNMFAINIFMCTICRKYVKYEVTADFCGIFVCCKLNILMQAFA